MQVNIKIPGGVCYAHGPYQTWVCPKLPACDTDPKHLEFLQLAGLSDEQIKEILGAECYCVCHSDYSSNSFCEHCKGDNKVGRFHKERDRLQRLVIQEAKNFFGSVAREKVDYLPLIEAVGDLLVHENQLTK